MHDITEGGLATALEELSFAGQHRIRVFVEKIPIFPQTEKISNLLGIDPMGLIGSGSLLICCRKESSEKMVEKIQAAGIQAACIGEVLEAGRGINALKNGTSAQWPRFAVDEITRLFE